MDIIKGYIEVFKKAVDPFEGVETDLFSGIQMSLLLMTRCEGDIITHPPRS